MIRYDLYLELIEGKLLYLPYIPTKLSDLESDTTHRTVTDEQITKWDNAAEGQSSAIRGVIQDFPCATEVYVKAMVYFDSTENKFKNAKADNPDTVRVYGVCINKTTPHTCDVLYGGITPELYTGLSIGKKYLSNIIAGDVVDSVITTPGHYNLEVGTSFTDKSIAIQIGTPVKRL